MSEGSDRQGFDSQSSETSHGVARPSKSQKHVKRPMNAFMVWAHERRKKMSVVSPTMHHSNISKILGAEWKMLTDQEKMPFVDKAKQIHEQHMADNPDYKYRPQRKVRSVQKRPRPLPPPLPIAPIGPSRSYAISVTGVAADNLPFEIPIIGVTSVRAYTMEEYNYRQNALPHLTQKASDFTTHHPAATNFRTTTPKISKEDVSKQDLEAVSPSPLLKVPTNTPAQTTTHRPVPFSLKPLVSGLKLYPTSAVASKVTNAQINKSAAINNSVSSSTMKLYIPNAKEAGEYTAFLLGKAASTTKSTLPGALPESVPCGATASAETASESHVLPPPNPELVGANGLSEFPAVPLLKTASEARDPVVLEAFEKKETFPQIQNFVSQNPSNASAKKD